MNLANYIVVAGALASIVVAVVRIIQLRKDLRKANGNRIAQLEAFADRSIRWRREFRTWLLDYAEKGAIDMRRIDMSTMPEPPDLPIDYTL